MTIKALIIDDEELARSLIRSYIDNNSSIEIVGECSNGFEGVKAINDLKPDLIFLDVQMPKITGFEMLELLEERPSIIFTTAYNEFAIQAFEQNAVDYLLKPFSQERFDSAINKALEKIKNHIPDEKANTQLLDFVTSKTDKLERIVVKTGPKIHVITIDKVNYFEAQDDYVMIYTDQGKHLKHKTMKSLEGQLDPQQFVRVHRSYLVKVSQISQLELYGKESYIIILKDGHKLPVSKSGYSKLKEVLNF